MDCSIFELSGRQVTLTGTNVYPQPQYHEDRVMTEHDLLLMYEGEWKIAQEGTVYHLHPGDVMLMHAGGHHWGTAPCSVNARNIFIHFNPLPGDRTLVPLTAAEVRSYATGSSVCIPPLVRCGLETGVTRLFNDIVNIFWSHQDDRQRRLSLCLYTLLNELSAIARHHQSESEEWIVHLLAAFHDEGDRFFSLEEAADIAHMSVRTRSARFQREKKKSVHQYQLDEKLETAYSLLRTGRHAVKEVAVSLGFSDPYYFSRVFKTRFGVPPAEIKRREPSANINRPPVV